VIFPSRHRAGKRDELMIDTRFWLIEVVSG
jgi:hypothetical protein